MTMPPCKDRASKRAPTLRKMTSSSLSGEDAADASRIMSERASGMSSRAKDRSPLTDDELRGVVNSLRNVAPRDADVDWDALARILSDVAHLSHKDWAVTARNSERLAGALLPSGGGLSCPRSRQMFERILHEGNWDGAAAHAVSRGGGGGEGRPWAVLVTGVNGIRKTTSVYQPWFARVVQEALVAPSVAGARKSFAPEELPSGANSFFRQLDHMIATLCNEEFSLLYALTGAQAGDNATGPGDDDPPRELVEKYSDLKASIFSRYRTLSELLGVLLLGEALAAGMNAMCETSGRDVAMFHYIDHFFPGGGYNKLALHFAIDDLGQAMESVDARMIREMRTGREALASGDAVEVIYANAGGPYGSEVLEGVRADSDRVWEEVTRNEKSGVGSDWYKASMRINAHRDKPWTIQAVRPDGTLGTEHAFVGPTAD